ncbi:HD-GYP domain-containing protein [Pararhizobium antarcticum]|uniref:Metal-dependent phosphohydrolase n=1 Tax=Pararhizobium antarcticum TaxID=1798805 RepID=A0A657LPE9_9HYPH|nr:HD domain-containing phosphohydrolase [Pararhizobium antarcticum]OJF93876.1 metal-dependent phosphohydrolase [Pararhizobium antarcticum]OJF99290.1 metal-dependent phosphohydrolase [Rhizobium sp. 58]
MTEPLRVGKAELLSALSHALDLTEGQPEGHGVRCCWIGMNIGRAIGLVGADLNDLYYTLLLKDIGCSSNAARICQLYLTDDRDFKRDAKLLDDSLPQVLRFVLSHTGLKAGLSERFRSLVTIFATGGTIARELIETRCQRGAEIVRMMRFPETVATGILDLDEYWNGRGKPTGLAGADISIHARIALMAQVADVFHTSSGPLAARREVARRAGSWFDPQLAAIFEQVASERSFWATLAAPDLKDVVIAMAGEDAGDGVDEDYLDDVAVAFAEVVDSKSPFTSGHSKRVALFTDLIAEEMGLDEARRRYLKRVALLHDIGKLGVSNQILDKPGKPDEAEWQTIRSHPGLSEMILSKIAAFADLARMAGAHHERLDGRGYPNGISGDQICAGTRIVTTADIFDALTADRPYRAAMPVSQALGIMAKDIGTALDPDCFDALARALQKLEKAAA